MQTTIFAMAYFHHYLLPSKFKLYTDHKPMCKLSSAHAKTLNRLQVKMTELHPELQYIEGKDNILADFFSRYHGMNVAMGYEDYNTGRVAQINSAFARMTHKDLGHPVQTVDASPFCVSMLQRDDPILSLIISDKNIPRSTFLLPTFGKLEHSRLPATVIDNVLYVKQLPRRGFLQTLDLRMAVPRSLRNEILLEAHNSLIGGHGGQFKTSERHHNKFWWPSMADDIAKHVNGCVACQASTTCHHSITAPLVPQPSWMW
jgi:hypothetical protein